MTARIACLAAALLGCGEGELMGLALSADARAGAPSLEGGTQPPALDATPSDATPSDATSRPDATPSDATERSPDARLSDAASPPDAAAPPPDARPPEPPVGDTLAERLSTSSVELDHGVAAGASNWRIWGRSSLGVAPVFTLPLADCRTLVGYTTGGRNAPVARALLLDAGDRVVHHFELAAGRWLRGLAAEPDGHFGALLWDPGAAAIAVTRFTPEGEALWSSALVNRDNRPTDFDIGDSRLEFGGGRYGAYYHVHSNTGHEGDTLQWVETDGSVQVGWGWGCSHSMSNLLRYHPGAASFLPVCVTDCFPGTNGDFATASQGGIYINHRGPKVIDVDAGCNGSVAGELGGAAVDARGWALVFNAHQAPMVPGQNGYDRNVKNQDIGFSVIGADRRPGPVVWLTNTPIDEADASIATWTADGAEDYVVGWSEGGRAHQLARVDGQGAILEGPVDVSATARWGRRDDPFRRHLNGDIAWAWFDAPGQSTLNLGRLRTGRQCP